MNQDRFDDLTRALGQGVSRRQALKLFGGTLAGGLLAALGVGEAAADNLCKPAGTLPQSKCTKDAQCCAGAVCQNGYCTAGCHVNGTFYAPGAPNPANGCQTCQPSVSTTTFTAITCPSVANATATCTSGVCGFTCNAGFGNCDGNAGNGCETNLLTDATNCGQCGHVCASGESCVSGSCTCGSHGDCPSGQSCCNGACVDEQSDVNNCGACGNACTTSVANATATCTSGVCGFTCSTGFKLCNGTCIPNDQCCGGCSSGETCVSGTCVQNNVTQCVCTDGSTPYLCNPVCYDFCSSACVASDIASVTCTYSSSCP